jgi:mono/diheme cytochrome c family protein
MKTIVLSVLVVLLSASFNARSDGTAPPAAAQKRAADELKQVVDERLTSEAKKAPERPGDFSMVMNGAKLFAKNCAQCHGPRAEGFVNWRRRDASGNFPPPPLDGSAHTWHHPRRQLANTIKNGGSVMPPFDSKLTDTEISNVINYLLSLWPDEIYALWAERNAQFEKRSQ